jgi:hypothetical protein
MATKKLTVPAQTPNDSDARSEYYSSRVGAAQAGLDPSNLPTLNFSSPSSRRPVAPAATPTPPPVDWKQAAKEQYGGYFAIIEAVPEISDLIQKAVQGDWSDAKFEYELRQTNWFKTNTASARQWDTLKQTDPATAQQQIDTQTNSIRNIANSLGLSFDDATIIKLAENSLRGNWDEQTLQNAVGAEAVKTAGGMSQLSTGFIGQQLKETASNYGITLSEQTFNGWINNIATGKDNIQSFNNYALNTAKTLYPGISAQLDAGQTFQQITDPYRQTAARILEINPETIDFTDPKWAQAVTFTTDRGEARPMNFNEWGKYLRNERGFGYEFTTDAKQRAFEVTGRLANLFGKA